MKKLKLIYFAIGLFLILMVLPFAEGQTTCSGSGSCSYCSNCRYYSGYCYSGWCSASSGPNDCSTACGSSCVPSCSGYTCYGQKSSPRLLSPDKCICGATYSYNCRAGECTAACSDGKTQNVACGNCNSGTQAQYCDNSGSNCKWANNGGCVNQKPCAAGSTCCTSSCSYVPSGQQGTNCYTTNYACNGAGSCIMSCPAGQCAVEAGNPGQDANCGPVSQCKLIRTKACSASDIVQNIDAVDDRWCTWNIHDNCLVLASGPAGTVVDRNCVTPITTFWEGDTSREIPSTKNSTLFGEKTINIPGNIQDYKIEINVTADDEGWIYIKNPYIPAFTEVMHLESCFPAGGCPNSGVMDITSYLVSGQNTIRFVATDYYGCDYYSWGACNGRMFDMNWNVTLSPIVTATCEPGNVAQGKSPVSASSTTTGSSPVTVINDGASTWPFSSWISNYDHAEQWAEINLGNFYRINVIRVAANYAPYLHDGVYSIPRELYVQYWDGTKWTSITPNFYTTNITLERQLRSFRINPAVVASKLRVYSPATNPSAGYASGIKVGELMALCDSTPPTTVTVSTSPGPGIASTATVSVSQCVDAESGCDSSTYQYAAFAPGGYTNCADLPSRSWSLSLTIGSNMSVCAKASNNVGLANYSSPYNWWPIPPVVCVGTDTDKDGYSTSSSDSGKLCCNNSDGSARTCLSGIDCLPNDAAKNPGTSTSCGKGGCAVTVADCANGAVQTCTPGTPTSEKCDGADNDCDESTDENWPTKGQSCASGTGECARTGSLVCNGAGTGLQCSAVPGNPGTEVCDDALKKDEDCDGYSNCLDSNCLNHPSCCADMDKDGSKGTPAGCGPDCDDLNNKTYPNAIELCDGEDNNCNNITDENLAYCDYSKLWCSWLKGAVQYDPNISICNGNNISAKVDSPELKCCLGTTSLGAGFDVYWASTANGGYKLLGAGQGDYIYCIAKGITVPATFSFKMPMTKPSEIKAVTGGMAYSSQIIAEQKGKYSCTAVSGTNTKTADLDVAEAGKSRANLPVFGIMQFVIAFSLIIIYQIFNKRNKNIKVKGSASPKLKLNPLASNQH